MVEATTNPRQTQQKGAEVTLAVVAVVVVVVVDVATVEILVAAGTRLPSKHIKECPTTR
jgi:hypothetical protein